MECAATLVVIAAPVAFSALSLSAECSDQRNIHMAQRRGMNAVACGSCIDEHHMLITCCMFLQQETHANYSCVKP